MRGPETGIIPLLDEIAFKGEIALMFLATKRINSALPSTRMNLYTTVNEIEIDHVKHRGGAL